MKYLYLAMCEHIKSTLPEILWMDKFNTQYTPRSDDQEMPFNAPAIFIEFLPMNWSLIGDGSQEGLGTITIHLVTENYDDTFQLDATLPSADPSLGLAHLDLAQKVFKTFQGFSSNAEVVVGSDTITIPVCSAFNRIATVPDYNNDTLNVDKISFEAMIFDYDAWKGWKRRRVNVSDLNFTFTINN